MILLVVLKRPDGKRSLVVWTASPAPDPTARVRVAKEGEVAQDYPLRETPRHIDLGATTYSISLVNGRETTP